MLCVNGPSCNHRHRQHGIDDVSGIGANTPAKGLQSLADSCSCYMCQFFGIDNNVHCRR